MSQNYDFDLFVIGGGSGGVRVARWSAGLGANVAICESDRYGGTCVIRGCIPKKLMVIGSHLPEEIETMKAYGWDVGSTSLDWQRLKQNRDAEIERLSGLYIKTLEKNKATVLNGRGELIDRNHVCVDGKTYSAKNIVIAVGGRPSVPEVEGIEHAIVSNGVFELSEQPKKVFVVGGGYIAVEMAGIFKGYGSQVQLAIRRDKILRGFDKSVRDFLQREIEKKGIEILTETTVKKIETKGTSKIVHTEGGQTFEADVVLYATGRIPNTDKIGIEKLGLEVGKLGELKVDEFHQTKLDNVYAIGDCTDRMNLTPVATAEGTMLAENLFNKKNFTMSYENIPSAVFSQPPLASVGLTEEKAIEKFGMVDVYESDFRALKFTLSNIEERTYMKLLVNRQDQKVIGAHMVGLDAAEIIQGVAIAIKAGATKRDFDATIGIHPTSAEEFVTLRNKRA